MNPDLDRLQPYPFQKLAQLLDGVKPPSTKTAISLGIGEPKHPTPHFIAEAIISHLHGLSHYPVTRGQDALRQAIAAWADRRFQLNNSLDPNRHLIPVSGTREALFSFTQAVVDRSKKPLVLMPNPFYQIYEGAAFLAGAEPYFLNCTADHGFLPDYDQVPAEVWQRCQILFVCSPGNPTGAVTRFETYQKLLALADEYDFVIASDECYSEIYFGEQPPVGLLEVAHQTGRRDFSRCMVFHSLSKRSNAPGMRSGFVAGDANIIEKYLLYRTYHGCTLPPPMQAASILAWQDEQHVAANRRAYQEKFKAVLEILQPVLEVSLPDASFYLWPKTPVSDLQFAKDLYAQENVHLLPGRYLSREANGVNPGEQYVRLALVAPIDECVEAAHRMRRLIERY